MTVPARSGVPANSVRRLLRYCVASLEVWDLRMRAMTWGAPLRLLRKVAS